MSQSFPALGVSTPVVRALAALNIHQPFAVQTLVLPDALAGLDVLAESPTGSGKTLAFGLPIVERTAGANGGRPSALVLVPTRELATQVAADLRPLAEAKGLRIATVYGGVALGPQAKKAKGAHVLVATPGRLHDLLERRLVALDGVRILVLDEADRMLDMGFKPQVDRILRTVPKNRQTMLFSATFDGAVAELARNYTDNASHFRAELPAEKRRGDIEHTFVPVTRRGQARPPRRAPECASAASHSSSFARSTAPTSSRASSRVTTSRPRRCTATSRRISASARLPGSSRAA